VDGRKVRERTERREEKRGRVEGGKCLFHWIWGEWTPLPVTNVELVFCPSDYHAVRCFSES